MRTPGIEIAARALSGGNQQKLIVGREILALPTFLIAAHPTRGIDVGAQARVWDDLRDARKAGLATLLDLRRPRRADRPLRHLLVLYGGRVVAELDPAKVTPAELGAFMTGAHLRRAGASAGARAGRRRGRRS